MLRSDGLPDVPDVVGVEGQVVVAEVGGEDAGDGARAEGGEEVEGAEGGDEVGVVVPEGWEAVVVGWGRHSGGGWVV